MAQISGAITIEIDLDRLADLVAVRVAAALRQHQAGDDMYYRDPGPVPAVRRGSVRYGAVTDHGEVPL